jgi:hypothetical protein
VRHAPHLHTDARVWIALLLCRNGGELLCIKGRGRGFHSRLCKQRGTLHDAGRSGSQEGKPCSCYAPLTAEAKALLDPPVGWGGPDAFLPRFFGPAALGPAIPC